MKRTKGNLAVCQVNSFQRYKYFISLYMRCLFGGVYFIQSTHMHQAMLLHLKKKKKRK